jgi:pimeloyl-ACP methyl ester carboxylesterase
MVIYSSAYTLGDAARKTQRHVGGAPAKMEGSLVGLYDSPQWFKQNRCFLLGSLLMSFTAPNDLSYLIVTIEAEDKHDFKDRLAEITVPTLVIAGDQDPILFRDVVP